MGGGEDARGCGGIIEAVQIQRLEDQNILNVLNANILYTGSWYLG